MAVGLARVAAVVAGIVVFTVKKAKFTNNVAAAGQPVLVRDHGICSEALIAVKELEHG